MEHNHDLWQLDIPAIQRSTCFDTLETEKIVVNKYIDEFGIEKSEEVYSKENVGYRMQYQSGFVNNMERVA